MSIHTLALAPDPIVVSVRSDSEETRWRRWQGRGQRRDRRSLIYARIVGAVVFSTLLVYLLMQILSGP